MKQCYTKVPLSLAFITLLFYLPTQVSAQCMCENGSTPQTITYQQTRNIRPIDDSTNFDLMQFNPAMGQLVCVNVFTYITGVVRMRLENDEIYPVSYRINYQRSDAIQGPGLNPAMTHAYTKNYGPYNLAASDGAYFSGPDFVAVGPDSVMKNKYMADLLTGGLAQFMGLGTMTYNYKVSGKTTVTGSINYIFSVSSQDIVTVGLTYSYCPTGLLNTDMKDFKAVKKSGAEVQLSWTTINEEKGNRYDIEASVNGGDFTSVTSIDAKTVAGSTASKYDVPYHMSQPGKGNIFFRVKQTDAAGQVIYTPVRLVNFEIAQQGFSIYPNPTKTKVQMQFDESVRGNFNIDIINISGQTIYTRSITVQDGNSINFTLPSAPPAGMYYLRAREINGSRTFSGKLLISK